MIRRELHRLLREEEAQATTEYILMMSVALTIVVSVIKKLIQPFMGKLGDALSNRLDNALFGGGGFHHLNIGH